MTTQPFQTLPRAGASRLADEWRERTPSGDAQDDEWLQRVNHLSVIGAVCHEGFMGLVLELAEDGPPVNHARDVPLLGTETSFVEVLPDAIRRDVFEVRVPMDRLPRERRRRQAFCRGAKDLGRFAAYKIGDAHRLRARIEAAQGTAVCRGRLVERAQAAPASAGDAAAPT